MMVLTFIFICVYLDCSAAAQQSFHSHLELNQEQRTIMTSAQIITTLHTLLTIKQPVFLWGAPGVGKSQVVAQVAEERNLALRDIRAVLLDPVDLRGLPRITVHDEFDFSDPGGMDDDERDSHHDGGW